MNINFHLLLIIAFFSTSSFSLSLSDELLDSLTLEELEQKLHITYESQNEVEKFLLSSSFMGNPENNCALRDDYKIPNFFNFMPAFKGKVFKIGDRISFGNHCFYKYQVLQVKKILLY